MKIGLLGYGKMGKAIEAIAVERGHEVVVKIGIENLQDRQAENFRDVDVAIEFSSPESAYENLRFAIDNRVPVVCGSTGWLNRYDEIKAQAAARNTGFLYASNFSIGVNIFFALNSRLAELMAAHPEYEVDMTEVHHTQKLDAPSGTAITLAEQILEQLPAKSRWISQMAGQDLVKKEPGELLIVSERTDPAPGTHEVRYRSEIDDISIRHTAHSRKGFATGAVLAAEFLNKKRTGIFAMKDVLGI